MRVPNIKNQALQDMLARPSVHSPQSYAFTLVEMLIVVGIIGLLISMILLIGQSVVTHSKVKDTQFLLTQLDDAIKTYAEEKPYVKVKEAVKRYNNFPPDDLMAYTPDPPTGAKHGKGAGAFSGMPNLMPGGLGTYYRPAPFVVSNLTDEVSDPNGGYVAFGGIRAMVFALRNNDKTRVIYEGISSRFRQTTPTTTEFFDTNPGDGSAFKPMVDQDVQYLVDTWGHPLEYFSAGYLKEDDTHNTLGDFDTTKVTSHGWISWKLTHQNQNRPVLVSYGPDGVEQLSAKQTLDEQYKDTVLGSVTAGKPVFDNPEKTNGKWQDDNVYIDDAFRDKVKEIKVP